MKYIIPADVPNHNGNVYPSDILMRELSKYCVNNKGLGYFGLDSLNPDENPWMGIDKTCFIVNTFRKVENGVEIDAKILDTPKGKILLSLLENPEMANMLMIVPRGMGERKDGVVQNSYSLMGLDVIAKEYKKEII